MRAVATGPKETLSRDLYQGHRQKPPFHAPSFWKCGLDKEQTSPPLNELPEARINRQMSTVRDALRTLALPPSPHDAGLAARAAVTGGPPVTNLALRVFCVCVGLRVVDARICKNRQRSLLLKLVTAGPNVVDVHAELP